MNSTNTTSTTSTTTTMPIDGMVGFGPGTTQRQQPVSFGVNPLKDFANNHQVNMELLGVRAGEVNMDEKMAKAAEVVAWVVKKYKDAGTGQKLVDIFSDSKGYSIGRKSNNDLDRVKNKMTAYSQSKVQANDMKNISKVEEFRVCLYTYADEKKWTFRNEPIVFTWADLFRQKEVRDIMENQLAFLVKDPEFKHRSMLHSHGFVSVAQWPVMVNIIACTSAIVIKRFKDNRTLFEWDSTNRQFKFKGGNLVVGGERLQRITDFNIASNYDLETFRRFGLTIELGGMNENSIFKVSPDLSNAQEKLLAESSCLKIANSIVSAVNAISGFPTGLTTPLTWDGLTEKKNNENRWKFHRIYSQMKAAVDIASGVKRGGVGYRHKGMVPVNQIEADAYGFMNL